VRARAASAVGTVLLAALVACAQSSGYWHVASGVAYTTLEFPNAKKPGATATLTVEYSVISGSCVAMVGLAVLDSTKFGTPLSSGRSNGLMTVSVLGKGTWTDHPVVARYSNGVESGMPASPDLIATMRTADTIHVQATSGTPMFEFSLVGAESALQNAASTCRRT